MQQLPFSILFARAFFVVKFYRTIYSFTFSAAFGRSLCSPDMLMVLVRLHNTQILCTFPRNVNNSWFLSRKLLSAEIWKISPVQCASMCVCVYVASSSAIPWQLYRVLVCLNFDTDLHFVWSYGVRSSHFFQFSLRSWSMLQQNSIRSVLWFVISRQLFSLFHCIALHTLCTLCYVTKAATSNENRRKTDRKKWAKLNYSRIWPKPNTLSKWISLV